MATIKLKVLLCFLLLNIAIVILNVTGTGQNLRDLGNKMPLITLTLLPSRTDSQDFLEINNQEPTKLHPFDELPKKLESLDWDPLRIDEVIRKFWRTEKTFLETFVDEKTKNSRTVLSTSCLHTAAWIVTGLLEVQKRPNSYMGIWKLPKDKNLIVYNNTQKPPSALAAPVIDSLRNFIDSRPANEPILLQVDMYQLKNQTSGRSYVDHHFAIHVYNGQISLYQGWQDFFSLIDWMREPGSFKFRYPMPVDTFLGYFETFLTYTEEDNARRQRLEETWKIFGITQNFVYGRKEVLDTVVRGLRYPWVVSLITHWPSPAEPKVMALDPLSTRL